MTDPREAQSNRWECFSHTTRSLDGAFSSRVCLTRDSHVSIPEPNTDMENEIGFICWIKTVLAVCARHHPTTSQF